MKKKGSIHPISTLIAQSNAIFRQLGFELVEGPEIESEHYNFDVLNIPPDHPSRDMHDTFFLKDRERTVLRTHTSPVQVRYMETHTPPFRIIVPGKVFRNEATDATHEAQFYQLEGLVVGEDVTLGDLKGVLEEFFKQLFGGSVEVRLRPSYFPFVEPGVEVDMRITGESAPPKLKDRWIEVMGAGMVHPNVLENAGVNPRTYRGYAFGVGIDRLLMLKHGIDDVRVLYSGDLRFVQQF